MEIWNPWRGCHKISEGCLNCYMFRRDAMYDKDTAIAKELNTDAYNLYDADGKLYRIQRKGQIPQAHKANIDI